MKKKTPKQIRNEAYKKQLIEMGLSSFIRRIK